MGKTWGFLAWRVLESPSLAPSSPFALAAPQLGFIACPAALGIACRGSCKCSPSPATLPKSFKPKSGMQDESSRLAAQPLGGFQRGLHPKAAMGQRWGSDVGRWGLWGCWSCPCRSQPPPQLWQGLKRGTQEEMELGCHVAARYPVSPMIFMALCWVPGAQLPLGASSAPPRPWVAATGGGEASVPAVAAFARQVLARRASVLGAEGGSVSLYLGQSQAPASPFLAGGKHKSALPGKLSCVAVEEPPASLGKGTERHGGVPAPCFGGTERGYMSQGGLGGAGQGEEALSGAGDAPG